MNLAALRLRRWPRRLVSAAAIGCCLVPATGCVESDAVSKFATQAHDALNLGQPVLEDLEGSCMRAHMIKAAVAVPPGTNQLFDANLRTEAANDPVCSAYAQAQPGELAILKVLTDYFGALSQLAATGTSATGKDSSASADKAKSSSPTEEQNAVAAAQGLAAFLGKVASNGYRERELEKAVQGQKGNVDAVIAALRDIVQNRYEDNQLVREKQEITDADGKLLPNADDATKALFRVQWQRSMDEIEKKHAAADAFLKALDKMQQGYDALCGASSLKAKDLPSLVQPYTDSIQSLIPSIEKAL